MTENDVAISRDAVIKTINNNTADERDGWLCIDNDLVHEIEQLPPVTQKSGKWIELPKAFDTNENPCKCSACGHILSFMHGYPKSNYCPNCGAKME